MAAGQWSGGKGSNFRQVDKKKFDENWEFLFGKKSPPKNDQGTIVINSVSDNEETLYANTKEEDKEET